jgi:hypothetical protein
LVLEIPSIRAELDITIYDEIFCKETIEWGSEPIFWSSFNQCPKTIEQSTRFRRLSNIETVDLEDEYKLELEKQNSIKRKFQEPTELVSTEDSTSRTKKHKRDDTKNSTVNNDHSTYDIVDKKATKESQKNRTVHDESKNARKRKYPSNGTKRH